MICNWPVTCYERAAEYQLVRLQLSLWLSATLSPRKGASWLPGYFAIQSAMSPISCSLVARIFYHPVGHVTHIVFIGCQDILPSSKPYHPYRARWLKVGTMFLDLKNHLVDEARVAPLLKHLGCFRHSWTGEPWSMWMLSYIFVANSIFGQFYKGGLFSLMAQRLVGISQYGEYRGL